MDSVYQLGGSTLNALSYLGSLVLLGARAACYSFVARLKGRPLRFERAISQAMDTGKDVSAVVAAMDRNVQGGLSEVLAGLVQYFSGHIALASTVVR